MAYELAARRPGLRDVPQPRQTIPTASDQVLSVSRKGQRGNRIGVTTEPGKLCAVVGRPHLNRMQTTVGNDFFTVR